MRSGELQTGQKNAANRRRTQQTMPFGNRRGRPVLFSRVSGRGVWDFSHTNILFFFFVLILSLIQNNRRFHVFDRRARSSFRESPRPDSRDGFETETRVGIGLNRSRSIGSKARLGSGQNSSARVGGFFLSRPRRARRAQSASTERDATDAFRRL